VTVTACFVTAGVGVCRVTVAVPGLVAADDVAVIGTFALLGIVAGAVYNPAAVIVPTVAFPPVTPPAAQVTV
jgi:hypothetical protein